MVATVKGARVIFGSNLMSRTGTLNRGPLGPLEVSDGPVTLKFQNIFGQQAIVERDGQLYHLYRTRDGEVHMSPIKDNKIGNALQGALITWALAKGERTFTHEGAVLDFLSEEWQKCAAKVRVSMDQQR